MIVTVTPNPSFDRTIAIDSFEPGGVMRVVGGSLEAGGKGVNVATALSRSGVAVEAVAMCGAASASPFGALVDPAVSVEMVTIPGVTRTNLTIREANGTTSKLNEPGPEVPEGASATLVSHVLERAGRGDWVAACGSLPPTMPSSFYADLAAESAANDVHLAVDTSGAALAAMVGHPCALLKPNREELAEVVGAAIVTVADAIAAAEQLRSGGARSVLVSLGSDGGLLVDAEGAIHGESPTEAVRNTVGAGDAMLAGFLSVAATGGDRVEALRRALAWGRAAVGSPTTAFDPASIDVEAVAISEEIDHGRVIVEAV